ncbi:uncharacterized protein LOC112468191 [Temnothorax curvispinosus]|uniref:Uncharacterized protein LOC112468191 n=1 Tax=Temnothorax curvispinosus TaxID=300111 RepID=A0A6J1RDJ6_9HYME|nr:uncharacterized protein LOC112468191 [Temnothorax curvispinosus]
MDGTYGIINPGSSRVTRGRQSITGAFVISSGFRLEKHRAEFSTIMEPRGTPLPLEPLDAKSRRVTSPAGLTLGLSHNETIMKRPTRSYNFLGNIRKSGTPNIAVGGNVRMTTDDILSLRCMSLLEFV